MVETNLPILYLREVVLFPGNEARLEFTSDEEKKILSYSQNNYSQNSYSDGSETRAFNIPTHNGQNQGR